MYHYIKGKLTASTPLAVTVETGGIGYKISIPVSLYSQLPPIGSDILLHTSFVIRDNSQSLFGFLSLQERDLFEEIINVVTGFGPKMALNLIGHLPMDDLYLAIQNHDIIGICKVPGIGKKTAERLIIEMRDKVMKLMGGHAPSDFAINVGLSAKKEMIADAMNALINLGYNASTAQKAVQKTLKELGENTNLPILITLSLKNVS